VQVSGEVGVQARKDACLLITLFALFIGILCCPGLSRAPSLSEPGRLPQLINPNQASIGSLVRLPGIGPVRARAIGKARQRVSFHQLSDLSQIKGIGPVTAQRLEPWLTFCGEDRSCGNGPVEVSVKEVGSRVGFDYHLTEPNGVSQYYGRMGNP
jgi:hypothetical protein